MIFLTVGLSTAFIGPFLSLFLSTAVHAGPVRIAAFLFLAPLASVTVSTLIGRFSDRRAIRRGLLVLAASAGCASSAATAFVRDYRVLLALAFTATAVAGSLFPQVFAYAREVLQGSPRAAMTMSTLRMLFSIAWVAGPPLATLLLTTGGFRLLYGSSAVLYAFAAFAAVRWLGPSTPVTAASRAPRGRLRPHVLVAVAALMLMTCAGFMGVQSMSLYVSHDLHGSVRDAGLILGLCAGIEIPLMLAFGALSTRYPLHRLVLTGSVLGLAYYVLAALATHSWELAAEQALNACFIAAVSGLGVSYIQDLLPTRPGQAATLFSNAYPVGAMLAGPLLGLAQHFGFRLAYAMSAALCLCGFALLLAVRRPRTAEPAELALVDVAVS